MKATERLTARITRAVNACADHGRGAADDELLNWLREAYDFSAAKLR